MSREWEITQEELVTFFKCLRPELQTFQLNIEDIDKSELIVKDLKDNEVVAIAGVRRVKFLPVCFIVVRNGYQGTGIGQNLIHRLHIEARRHGHRVLFSSVIKGNHRAIDLFHNCGYRKFFMKGKLIYLFKVLK